MTTKIPPELNSVYAREVTLRGVTYPSAEHAFTYLILGSRENQTKWSVGGEYANFSKLYELGHTHKFIKKWEERKFIGLVAKKLRKKLRELRKIKQPGNTVGIWVRIMKAQAKQHPEFATMLKNTGNTLLYKYSKKIQQEDTNWFKFPHYGNVVAGRLCGLNYIGKALMVVRSSLSPSVASPPGSSSSSSSSLVASPPGSSSSSFSSSVASQASSPPPPLNTGPYGFVATISINKTKQKYTTITTWFDCVEAAHGRTRRKRAKIVDGVFDLT